MRFGITSSIVSFHILLISDIYAQGFRTDSRAPYTHIITIYDRDENKVDETDVFEASPYSPSATCGKCHNINLIGSGWHFNAADTSMSPGRRGEPWIWMDAETRTQLPMSFRRWRGVYHPHEVGVSRWRFLKKFGRHMPGGGLGSLQTPSDNEDEELQRWNISGALEIDCMICHSASFDYDTNEWAKQIEEENLMWAPTAAVGLAEIRGNTKELPEDFDWEFPEMSSDPFALPPTTKYDQSQFRPNGRVFFNTVRTPMDEKCYYCHTNHLVDEQAAPRFQQDVDIHLVQGMSCTDCHRHGLDHQVTRGYEGEEADSKNVAAGTLTCASCHIGNTEAEQPEMFGGRLGAPLALHRGIPPVHFDLLSCTSCHSGPWPKNETYNVQTSMAHGLGLADEHRKDGNPPHIVQPVFLKQDDGKIAPHRLLYPSFWGRMQEDDIVPLEFEIVEQSIKRILEVDREEKEVYPGGWKPIDEQAMLEALNRVQSRLDDGERAVYVTGGKVHKLETDSLVVMLDHVRAAPYTWPLAHDVRGASQSLGARGCEDCHAFDSPFFASTVTIDSLMASGDERSSMSDFVELSTAYNNTFAISFIMRPWLKVICWAAALVLLLAFR